MFGTLVRLQGFVRRGSFACAALIATAVISACGSSKPAAHRSASASARSVLHETFGARHPIDSGVLTFTLTLTPTGAAAGADPVSVNLEGPFQNRGNHRPAAFDFNVLISLQGKTESLSLISTGTAGYVSTGGHAYKLPASSIQQIESGLFSAAGPRTTTASTAAAGMPNLGIDPQHWLVDPRIVGSDLLGGVATTHIHAGVDVDKFVADVSPLLAKVSALGLSSQIGSVHISAPGGRQIVSAIRHPSVDLWSASSDRTLRKLSLLFDVSPRAPLAALVGSGSTAALTLQFSGLGKPQQIIGPTHALPFSALQQKLHGVILRPVDVPANRMTAGTATVPERKTRAKPAGPQELTLSPYAQCISNAAPDVAKMQKCATLSNGSSAPVHAKH